MYQYHLAVVVAVPTAVAVVVTAMEEWMHRLWTRKLIPGRRSIWGQGQMIAQVIVVMIITTCLAPHHVRIQPPVVVTLVVNVDPLVRLHALVIVTVTVIISEVDHGRVIEGDSTM